MKQFTQLGRTATTPLKRKLLHNSNLKEIESFKSSSLNTEQNLKTNTKQKITYINEIKNQSFDQDKTFVHPSPIAFNPIKMETCHLEKT